MDLYILLLIALATLAIIDLVVGVSNDAVNFLNSGIGSKALSFKTLMIIASLGVFLGAATSSGMMEVARKGIFVPGEFYFNEITNLGKYINSEKALEIIMGIFLSIFIAFTIGSLTMFVARSIYSFHYKVNKNYLHALFGGIALTAITHFIVLDGIKATPFYKTISGYVAENELFLIALSFFVWTIIGFVFTRFTKINLLKIIIGLGTFSLALAFAGNDLVNFIGAPLLH